MARRARRVWQIARWALPTVTNMNVGPQVPVYLTMIWLPLGLLVTVVYLVVYGIAYKRRGLIVAGGSILAVIVAGLLLMSLNFVHRDNHRSGVPWRTAVAAARVECAGGADVVDVHTQPSNWVVPVPCALLG